MHFMTMREKQILARAVGIQNENCRARFSKGRVTFRASELYFKIKIYRMMVSLLARKLVRLVSST